MAYGFGVEGARRRDGPSMPPPISLEAQARNEQYTDDLRTLHQAGLIRPLGEIAAEQPMRLIEWEYYSTLGRQELASSPYIALLPEPGTLSGTEMHSLADDLRDR